MLCSDGSELTEQIFNIKVEPHPDLHVDCILSFLMIVCWFIWRQRLAFAFTSLIRAIITLRGSWKILNVALVELDYMKIFLKSPGVQKLSDESFIKY